MSDEQTLATRRAAAAVITTCLTQHVDTGMGNSEPLTETYTPEGVGIFIAWKLDAAGLLSRMRGGVIEVPWSLTDEQARELRRQWEAARRDPPTVLQGEDV